MLIKILINTIILISVAVVRVEMAWTRENIHLWPNGVIPYVLDFGVGCPDSEECKVLMSAFSEYQEKTCIAIKERINENKYIKINFNSKDACEVDHDFNTNGMKKVSLGKSCWKRYTVMQIIGYIVGLLDEITRPDRDDFVKIIYDNVKEEKYPNVAKILSNDGLLLTDFDLKSIMMFSPYEFSKNGRQTIIYLNPEELEKKLKDLSRLSDEDVKGINLLYNCPEETWVTFKYRYI